MEKLWGNDEKTIDSKNEQSAPKCQVCKGKMRKMRFADGSVGWACTCAEKNDDNILNG